MKGVLRGKTGKSAQKRDGFARCEKISFSINMLNEMESNAYQTPSALRHNARAALMGTG
jgi:hypothetical protein